MQTINNEIKYNICEKRCKYLEQCEEENGDLDMDRLQEYCNDCIVDLL